MVRNYKPKQKGLAESYERGFLQKMDARSKLTKSLQRNFDNIVEDLGGYGVLSHIQLTCIERFVFLQATVNQMEATMAHDPKMLAELLPKWTQSTNALVGIAKTLGVQKKILSSPWLEGSAQRSEA